jgi:hypothetical protein
MERFAVYPQPQWLREQPGHFLLRPGLRISVLPSTEKSGTYLAQKLEEDYGLQLPVQILTDDGLGDIVVGMQADVRVSALLATRGTPLPERASEAEGFALDVSPEGVVIAGADAAGTFYGVQAFRALCQLSDEGLLVPAVQVADWPYKPMRGIHLYMPGAHTLDFTRRLLDALSFLRYNTLFIEVGGGMEYERHPEINTGWQEFCAKVNAWPGGPAAMQSAFAWAKDSTHTELGGGAWLSKSDVRGLVAYARSLFYEVIPEVQAFSHAYYLCYPHREIAERLDDPFPDTYCPSNPKTYELLFDLLDEVSEVFQPKTIHIGHDELYTLGICEHCQGKSGVELLAGEITKIHDYLAQKGIRTALWADKLMPLWIGGRPHGGLEQRVDDPSRGKRYLIPETWRAIEMIPKDILLLDWYYRLDPRSEDYFGKYGFQEVFGNFGGNFAPHDMHEWSHRSAPQRVLGAEVSTWCAVREDILAYNGFFFNAAFSANLLWWPYYQVRDRGELLERLPAVQQEIRRQLAGRCVLEVEASQHTHLPLDLSAIVNHRPAFADTLTEMEMTAYGTPFHLVTGDPQGCLAARVSANDTATGPIRIGRRVDGISFLHYAESERRLQPTWQQPVMEQVPPECRLGHYLVTYQDGTTEQVPIDLAGNVARWDVPFGESIYTVCYWAEPVVIGYDPAGRPVTAYRYQWHNPHPDKAIESVSLEFAGPEGDAVALLSATAFRHGVSG